MKRVTTLLSMSLICCTIKSDQGLPLFYWKHQKFTNFGDYISLKIVERMVGQSVQEYERTTATPKEKKLLAVGSIISWANEGDVVWGSGIKRESYNLLTYRFKHLDVRCVRGPLTRAFLQKYFDIECPEVYGDPALLIPLLFPEFQKKKNPKFSYLIIPHYSEQELFPKDQYHNVIYPTDHWIDVINAILDSEFVISGSLHGVIIAEAFGIPARAMRPCITEREPLFKWHDYYLGTGRADVQIAKTLEEALELGPERPIQCDIKKIYDSFPFEFWKHTTPE